MTKVIFSEMSMLAPDFQMKDGFVAHTGCFLYPDFFLCCLGDCGQYRAPGRAGVLATCRLFGDEEHHEGADEKSGEREFDMERIRRVGAEKEGEAEQGSSDGDEDSSEEFCPDIRLMYPGVLFHFCDSPGLVSILVEGFIFFLL